MLTIGLTGGIGSGKSTVSQWFKNQGIPVIDADKAVHRLLQSDSDLISRLIMTFGSDIAGETGEILRGKLGKLVFADAAARKSLEGLVHPRVLDHMNREREVLENSGEKVCVWDVPLLFETGFEQHVDKVWVVWVPRDIQLQRVLKRDNLGIHEAEARIAAQGSLDEKCQRADTVIDNSGSIQETIEQLIAAWNDFKKHI
ncbi:dephospho-CoA kinase [Desulfosporosinus acidiphilus SJ4]|uniref:Dephospho-CoA kinase n=1 Tax=Desulfosporosinus acidiphilus (strain DSM 22704 / JCM 16185 / SJ4) TaxID=646529 RepID=I4D8Q6_DESAJ|nr:dephospho-CoA kinase [Desulfosporosinus acidiphilus]AFM42180.1 dephospho-CoA kinase [Desulfosporosinus acidiphilus SJ4]